MMLLVPVAVFSVMENSAHPWSTNLRGDRCRECHVYSQVMSQLYSKYTIWLYLPREKMTSFFFSTNGTKVGKLAP